MINGQLPLATWNQARFLGRFILAEGEFCEEMGPPGSTVFKYVSLGAEYILRFTPVETNIMILNLYAMDWEVTMWLNSPLKRRVTDLKGNRYEEWYLPATLPLMEEIRGYFRHLRNGAEEDDTVIYAFWLLTFGKMGRSKISESRFRGKRESFDRDILMIKMNPEGKATDL